ncbi:glycosyltransferase [Kitasatospora sp. NBC_01539]|uniref:glycosyltransferase n=1 Tax=Kitasatospora sp. NBC_01539 TaxID=2903577 RepID=UPI0038601F00
MNGHDRRTPAACPRPVARTTPYTPVRVVELDLDAPERLCAPGGLGPVDPDGRVLALVRQHGHPLGLVSATGTAGDPATLRRALVAAAHRELHVPAPSTATPGPLPGRAGGARVPADGPTATIIVCTRDRGPMLRECLDSVLGTAYPHTEVIVVDNAPSDDVTRELVRTCYADRVRYVHEPVAGLARARNTGLAAARGEICAFTDDDALVDPGWVTAMVAAFGADDRIGCVTGLVLPAELDTPAQEAFESYGGYAKGFAPHDWTWHDGDGADDPLLPFAVGRFGTGANMALRTAVIRGLGGFDEATGAGTPTRGGEDLLAFFRVMEAGYTVAYRPDAVAWHRHRRTDADLRNQIYGFGVGFGAYLTAAVVHRPRLIVPLARRVPRGLRQWHGARRTRAGTAGRAGEGLHLGRKEFQGLLYGPISYLVSVRRRHTHRVEGMA